MIVTAPPAPGLAKVMKAAIEKERRRGKVALAKVPFVHCACFVALDRKLTAGN